MEAFLKHGMDLEFKERYDRSIVNPKDKWDYSVYETVLQS